MNTAPVTSASLAPVDYALLKIGDLAKIIFNEKIFIGEREKALAMYFKKLKHPLSNSKIKNLKEIFSTKNGSLNGLGIIEDFLQEYK